jgi:adenosylcobinamide-phosphate guanylyltransferase
MIGLIMAGGRGTRMHSNEEKLLLNYKKPVILHVVDALQQSNCFSKIIALTSPNSPKTEKILKETGIDIISSRGESFVSDLNEMLQQLDEMVFVTSGDLPLLDSQIVKTILDHHEAEQTWTSIVTTLPFQKTLGIKSDCIIENHDYAQTGISIVNAKKITNLDPVEEKFLVIDDKRIGLNLNTKDDYNLLRSL